MKIILKVADDDTKMSEQEQYKFYYSILKTQI